MPQIDNHLKWCLKDPRRLIKEKPDLDLAQKHLKKSEYNYGVLQALERLKIYDWALNAGFYAICSKIEDFWHAKNCKAIF